jgi:hypothetical protein
VWVVRRSTLLFVVVAAMMVVHLVANDIPVSYVIPPGQTLVLLVVIPLIVGTFAADVRMRAVALVSTARRRAEAATAPRPRRGETSGSSNPSIDQAGDATRRSPLELSDSLAS